MTLRAIVFAILNCAAACEGATPETDAMALPLSRNRTYSAGSPVVSGDLNDLQDQAIAAYAGRHGDLVLNLSAAGAILGGAGGGGAYNSNGYWTSDSADDFVYLGIPLHQGNRIKSIRWKVWSGGAGLMVMDLARIQPAEDVAELFGEQQSTNPTDAVITFVAHTVSAGGYIISADEIMLLRFYSQVAGDRFYGAAITYDRP